MAEAAFSAIGSQVLGSAAAAGVGGLLGGFSGGNVSASGPPPVFKTPTFRLDTGNAGEFKLSRRPNAAAKGGLSSQALIETQERLRSNIARTLESQRAFRGGFGDLRTRIQALSPDFQSLRDESALFRASTNEEFGSIADTLLGLRGDVAPGFSRLRQVLTDSIRNRRNEAVGNLRASLSRRRVLGSSFAEDAEGRVRAEFSQLENEALAEATIREIEQSQSIAQSRAAVQQALAGIVQSTLAFEAGIESEEFNSSLRTLSLELGLNQLEQQGLRDELATIQADQAAFQQIIDRENQELALVGNISLGLQSIVSKNAQFDALTAIQGAQAAGEAAGGLVEGIFSNVNFGDLFGNGFNLTNSLNSLGLVT